MALGSSTPASACTAVVMTPSGAPGMSIDPGRQGHNPRERGVEELGLADLAVERVPGAEDVAERIRGGQRDRGRPDDRGVQQDHREQRAGGVAEK